MATSACLADRILAFTEQQIDLSPERMVLCDFLGKELISDEDQSQINKDMYDSGVGACSGNTLPEAFGYLYRLGTCLESCSPYDTKVSLAQESNDLPLCQDVYGKTMDSCIDGSPIRIFRGVQVYRVGGTKVDNGSERDIREDIFCYGPVCTGMAVYSDFSDYYKTANSNTVYKHSYGQLLGGHAIEIVGWGEGPAEVNGQNKQTKFWIVRNSWGTEVGGDNGFFKIVRGTNECELEANVFSIIPDVPGSKIVKYYPSVYAERDQELREQYPVLPSGYPLNLAESLKLTNAPSFFPTKNYDGFKAVLTGNLSNIGKVSNMNFPQDPDDIKLINELQTTGGKAPLTQKKLSIGIGGLLSATETPTGGTTTTSYVWLLYFIIPLLIVVGFILYNNYKTKQKHYLLR
jgi:hypothetical protein